MTFSVHLLDHKLKIDDPVGAVSVHGVCGIIGTLCVGLFDCTDGLLYGGGWSLLGVQALGVLCIALWSFGLGFGLMKLLHRCSGIRVSARIEEEGLDVYEHGESAYNN